MTRFFRALVPIGALRLLLVEALLIAGSLLLATYLFAYPDAELFLLVENGVVRLAIVLATLVTVMQLRGLYSPGIRRQPRLFLLQELCLALGITLIVGGALSYLSSELRTPVRISVAGGLCALVAILAWRSVYGTVVWKSAERRVLLVGNSALLNEVAAYLKENPDAGLQPIGFAGEPAPEREGAAGKYLGSLSRLDEIVGAVRPDLIVAGLRGNPDLAPIMTLFKLRTGGLHIEEDFVFLEKMCGYFSLKQLRPSRLIFSLELEGRQSRLSEAVDFVVAALALLASLPVMICAVIAIKLSSGGPALHTGLRVGKRGEVFPLYRFRFAEEHRRGLIRLLGACKVDQWPQLFNVLRGEMSIVGPRPERPEFVRILAKRIPFYCQLHAVKPGITGWAQIQYRTRPEDTLKRLEYDFFYIKYMSQMMNNYVIFRAINDAVRGRGRSLPPGRSVD